MKVKAFILIETMRGKSCEVNNILKHLDGVHSTELVTPPYDIIAIAESEIMSDIDNIVKQKIQPIDGITRTVICTASPSGQWSLGVGNGYSIPGLIQR
jgi:DNA-binding Lrp family transcriptional regulator